MPRTTTLHAVTAIGIDMGKTTLHMIGLDARGAIVLRERVLARTHRVAACERAPLPHRHRSGNGDTLCRS